MIGKEIGKGRTATVYEYNNNVIKVFNKNFPNGPVEREFKYSKLASDHDCNVPKVYKLHNIDGAFAIEMEKIIGITFSDIQFENISNPKEHAKIFAEAQINYHQIEVKENDLNTFFMDRLDFIKELSADQINQIKEYTSRLPKSNHLCHGDYHPGNIMISKDKTYVIDWMNGYYGNPLSDVCRTFLMIDSPGTILSLPEEFREGAGIYINIFLNEYLDYYCKMTNTTENEIYKWLLPVASLRLLENIPFEKEWLLNTIKERLQILSSNYTL